MRLLFASLLALGIALSPASAEIEKYATPCDAGLCFRWWPKLAPLEGWQHDREQSLRFGVNALAPDGSTFADAETVMYAKALYKPRQPELKSLALVIEQDKKTFADTNPGMAIEEVAPLTTADGQKLRSFTFSPKGAGNWERVSYGEEGDFYLLFTVSSRSAKGHAAGAAAYARMVESYREHPQPQPKPRAIHQ